MTLSISHPEPGVRLGADQCPGTDERGHGLTMAVIHDAGCCQEWETGQASTPARAGSFRQAAARWGTAWPESASTPPLAPNLRPSLRRKPDGPASSLGRCPSPHGRRSGQSARTDRPAPFLHPLACVSRSRKEP